MHTALATLALLLLVGLAGCSAFGPVDLRSACATTPGSYECQIERYNKAM
jgi:predicted small lipoprotein YifL